MSKFTRFIPWIIVIAAIFSISNSDNQYWISLATVIGIQAILVLGISFLLGYANIISFAQSGLYGLGAYASAYATLHWGVEAWMGLIFAIIITGIVAIAVALPSIRLSGHHLAIATLGLAIIFYVLFMNVSSITGGGSGLMNIPRFTLFGYIFDTSEKYLLLVWGAFLIILFFLRNLLKKSLGRSLMAIGSSQAGAESLGINSFRVKIYAFVVSAMLAGVAGSLYAHYVQYISPSVFGLESNITLIVMAVFGGVASLWGPLIGTTVIILLTDFLKAAIPTVLPNVHGPVEIVIFGLLLVLTLIFMPKGLMSIAGVLKTGRRTGLK